MPVITHAIFVPINAAPEPTALRHAPATQLTAQQQRICAELGVSFEAFAAAQRGDLFAGKLRQP